jgi:hypothetical protein
MANIKDIPHPIWEEIRDGWLSHIPVGLSPSSTSVEQLIQLSGQDLKGKDKTEISVVDGLAEKTFCDALFLRHKANYCFRISETLNKSGHPTWTALSMYDACYFAAKALVYLLGLRDVGGASKAYIHLFNFEVKKKRRIQSGQLCLNLGKRLEHENLWSIFSRLLDTIKGDGAGIELIKRLKKNDFDKFSSERNRLIYQCGTWSRDENYEGSDLFYDVSYISNVNYFVTSGECNAEYHDKYYRTAHATLNVIDALLKDIGALAPAVADHLTEHVGLTSAHHLEFA